MTQEKSNAPLNAGIHIGDSEKGPLNAGVPICDTRPKKIVSQYGYYEPWGDTYSQPWGDTYNKNWGEI